MRPFVGIITIIATVIHFTFGCCLHSCHAGGRGDCATQGIETAECEDCCHVNHAHAHADEDPHTLGEAHTLDEGDAPTDVGVEPESDQHGVRLAEAPARDACHGCEGCRCAATCTDSGIERSWQQAAEVVVPGRAREAITAFGAVCDTQPPDPDIHLCPGRTPLFERFLI